MQDRFLFFEIPQAPKQAASCFRTFLKNALFVPLPSSAVTGFLCRDRMHSKFCRALFLSKTIILHRSLMMQIGRIQSLATSCEFLPSIHSAWQCFSLYNFFKNKTIWKTLIWHFFILLRFMSAKSWRRHVIIYRLFLSEKREMHGTGWTEAFSCYKSILKSWPWKRNWQVLAFPYRVLPSPSH